MAPSSANDPPETSRVGERLSHGCQEGLHVVWGNPPPIFRAYEIILCAVSLRSDYRQAISHRLLHGQPTRPWQGEDVGARKIWVQVSSDHGANEFRFWIYTLGKMLQLLPRWSITDDQQVRLLRGRKRGAGV